MALLQQQGNRIALAAAGGDPDDREQTLADFCFFSTGNQRPRPAAAAGAALLALLDRELLPWFAANGPWVQDLVAAGKGEPAPRRLCWAADGAILLAPVRSEAGGNSWTGFLIAEAKAAGQALAFADEHGNELQLLVPADAVPPQAFAGARGDAELIAVA